MRFFSKVTAMLLSGGALFGSVSDVNAAHAALANTCVPAVPSDAGKIAYTATGVKNTTAGSIATVSCFAGQSNSGAVTTISVFLVDQNPAVLTACHAFATNPVGGAISYSELKTSNASMSFTVPAGPARLLSVSCSIPYKSGANESSITAIFSN